MPDITSASDFIAEPPAPSPYAGLAGGGPMAAASGNLGGLQAALYQSSKPIMSPERMTQVQDTMFSRLRKPEDVEAGKEARRGALSAIQSANAMPESDWEPQRYVAYGMMKNDKPWDVTNGWRNGLAMAMEADLGKQAGAKKSAVENASLGLKFEQQEEGYADKLEGNAMGDLGDLAQAQSRISAFQAKAAAGGGGAGGGTRFKNVAGVGMVDTQNLDPATGAPKVVVQGPTLALIQERSIKAATALANNPQNPMTFEAADGKSAAEVREAWIMNTARTMAQGQLIPMLDPQLGGKADISTRPAPGGVVAPGVAAPTNAGERRAAAGVAALPNGGATDGQRLPVMPSPDALVAQNTRDIAKLDSFINDPSTDESLKATAIAQRDALVKSNVQAMRRDITKIGSSGVQAPVPAVPPAPAATTPAIPGVKLSTKEEEKRGTTYAEGTSKGIAEMDNDMFHKPVAAASSALTTVSEMRQLAKDFTPGALAPIKKVAGNLLEAIGVQGSLVREATTITEAQRTLQKEVNEKIRNEKGVQTDTDAQRQMDEGMNIKDPKAAFMFTLAQAEERAKRVIARSDFVKQLQTQPDAVKKNLTSEWLAHSERTLGPSFTKIGERPVFRSEFIAKAIQANPNMDPKEVEAAAAQDWLNRAAPKKEKK